MSSRWLFAAAATAVLAISGAAPGGGTRTNALKPTPRPQVLWRADFEKGSLVDWYAGGGGGEFNSGSGDTNPSQKRAHSGSWSARSTLSSGAGGTRLFRWTESRGHRELFYEAWVYFPRHLHLSGPASRGRFWNLFQFKSTSGDRTLNDPIWFLNVREDRKRRALVPELVWWHRTLEGPRSGQSGNSGSVQRDVRFPIGRWFRLTARLRQSKDFDGRIRFWLDGRQIFDRRGVRTGYDNCAYNAWCVDQGWSINLYSDGLDPKPDIYFDDASISGVQP